jgi:hypothetical protein
LPANRHSFWPANRHHHFLASKQALHHHYGSDTTVIVTITIMDSSTTSKTVTLDQPSNWKPWLFVVKTIADGGDIWKYINPELDTEPVVPNRPEKPTPQEINPNKPSILGLDAAEKETFKLLLSVYKEDLAIAKQVLDTIQTVRNHIVKTVSTKNITYIDDKTTVYQMLVALKKRLAPTDYAQKLDVVQKYNKLKTYSKEEDVEKWLKDWETIYTDGKKLNIPEVADERSLFDFTHAVSVVDSGYSSTQEYFINQKIKNSETLPELYDLVEDFRNHYRRTEALNTSASHSAFSTTSKSTFQDLECVCGLRHPWKKCFYLIQSIRPATWTPDAKTQEKIDQKLASDPKLKAAVEDKISWMKWKAEKENTKVEGTSSPLGSF